MFRQGGGGGSPPWTPPPPLDPLPPPPSPPRSSKSPAPPLLTKVTILEKNGIYRWENLVRSFLLHKFFWVPRPPPLAPF